MKNLVYGLLKVIRVFGFFILLGCPFYVFSQDNEDNNIKWVRKGEVLIRAYQNVKEDTADEANQTFYGRVRVDNEIELVKWNMFLNVNAEGRFKSLVNGNTDNEGDLLIKDAYLDVRRPLYSLRIGRQTVTWGKLDDIAILDKITPQDYEWFVLFDKQDRKDPAFMVKFDLVLDESQLETVFIPFLKPSDVKYFGSDWSVFGHTKKVIAEGAYSQTSKDNIFLVNVRDRDEVTDRTFENGQAAMRFRSKINEIDYALYYMFIYDNIPTLRENSAKGNTLKRFLYIPTLANLNALNSQNPNFLDLTLEKEYARMHVVGLDFETVLGAYGVRGELGFFTDRAYLRTDFSYVEKDTLSLGIGIDHTTEQDYYFNLQFIEDVIFSYEDLFAQEEFTHQIAFSLSKNFLRGNLICDFDSNYNFSRGDWMLNPKVGYKFINGVETYLGAFVFGGDMTTLFGRYKDNDLVYLETIWHF